MSARPPSARRRRPRKLARGLLNEARYPREATQATPPLCPPGNGCKGNGNSSSSADAKRNGHEGFGGSRKERGGRKRRRGGQGQVPVAVTGSGPRQVQLLRRGPGPAHRGRPSRQDLDACWHLAQRGRHVVSIGPPRRASAGPARRLMVTAATTPVLSPNPRAAHTWRSPVGQSASAADLIDAY